MSFDEPKGKKAYSCKNCGHSYEASPPDDIYVIAMVDQCVKCKTRENRTKKWTYECDNCHTKNDLYWHQNQAHNPSEPYVTRPRSLSSLLSESRNKSMFDSL